MQALTLAVGLLAAICVFLWAVRDPIATILPVYAFLVPLGGVFALRVPLPPPFNTLSSGAGALVIVALAIHLIRSGAGRIPSVPAGMWLLYVGWGGATVLWAVDPSDVVREITLAVPLLAIMLLVACEPVRPRDLRRIAWATLAPGAAIGAFGVAVILAGGSFPEHGLSARFSLAASPADTNPNQLAASLLLPLMLGLGMTLYPGRAGGGRWHTPAATTCTALTAIAIALSGSRGGALATVIGTVVTFWLSWRWSPWLRPRIRRLLRTGTMGIALLVVAGALSLAVAPGSRVAALLGGEVIKRLTEVDTSSGRAEIWTAGALACTRYCGQGSGLGTFSGVYNDVLAFSNVTRNVGLSRPGHNLYLEIAVETGLLGMLLFWTAVGAEFRTISRRRAAWLAPSFAAAIAAILTADIFEGFLWFKHAWLPFTLIRVFEGAADADTRDETAKEASLAEGAGP